MKFREDSDKVLFLLDINSDIKESNIHEISSEQQELFLKKRGREKTFELKNFRKSQLAKHNWRAKKLKYLRGIRKFHRSIAGKKFHRSLSRFLLTRESYDRVDLLKSASSLKTHLYIDLDYYRGLDEAVDFEIFVESITELINHLENNILLGKDINSSDYSEILEALNFSDVILNVPIKKHTGEPDYDNYIEYIKQLIL